MSEESQNLRMHSKNAACFTASDPSTRVSSKSKIVSCILYSSNLVTHHRHLYLINFGFHIFLSPIPPRVSKLPNPPTFASITANSGCLFNIAKTVAIGRVIAAVPAHPTTSTFAIQFLHLCRSGSTDLTDLTDLYVFFTPTGMQNRESSIGIKIKLNILSIDFIPLI